MSVRGERLSGESGLTMVELLVSMVIVAIVGLAATEVLITFYQGKQQAMVLSNRVATAAMLDDVMDHTVAQSGYGEAAPSISVTASSVAAAWSSAGHGCTGVMKVTQGGMAWTASSAAATSTANASCGAGSAFLPVGDGWAFSMQPGTNCNYNAGTTFPELVATNQSAKLEVPACLQNLPGQ
ncbi:type II secretion system protein [Acidithiobacillus ferrivorans]|nr:type II secretion system protein [Acidithiobacillus ferrivorans]